jgi:hypothetical protein
MTMTLFDTGRPPALASPPTSMELRVRVTTLPLGGRSLLVARVGDEMRLAAGFDDDDALRVLAGAVRVPLSAWPELAAAAAALLEDAES